MRSRRYEVGSGGSRFRSSPPISFHDPHGCDWHPNRGDRKHLSPSSDRERLSRRVLRIGERRSLSVERRAFPGHLDSGGDRVGDMSGIYSQQLDESFPYREAPHSWRRKHFDPDAEANPDSGYVGINSIRTENSAGPSKAANDKGFLGYGPSAFESLIKDPNATVLDDRMMPAYAMPSASVHSSSGFNTSKIGRVAGTYYSASSSFGGNLDEGISDRVATFNDKVAFSRMISKEHHGKVDKPYTMPPSAASHLNVFRPSSGDLFSDGISCSYRGNENLHLMGGCRGSIGDKYGHLDSDVYIAGKNLFEHPTTGPDLESKATKLQRFSPSRNESFSYSVREIDHRGRVGSRAYSDEPYERMQPSDQEGCFIKEPLASTFIGHREDRSVEIDSSYRIQRGMMGSVWNQHKQDTVSSYRGVSRGDVLTMDHFVDHFNHGDRHPEVTTDIVRDHDIMHSGTDDYSYGSGGTSIVYKEKLKSLPSDYDPDAHGVHMDAGMRLKAESLEFYEPSERSVRRKFLMDEVSEHNPRNELANTWSVSRNFHTRNGNDELQRWTDKDQLETSLSKKLFFGHPSSNIPKKSFDRMYEATPSSARLPFDNFPSRLRVAGRRDASLKKRLKPLYSEFHNSFDEGLNFNGHKKIRKKYGDDRHCKTNAKESRSEDVVPLKKIDPPEGSVEFKQQVEKAFFRFCKLLNENLAEQRRYKEQGKAGSLLCSVCGSLSKEFSDTHNLAVHAFNSLKVGLRTDHLGLHKALCVMMGWSSLKAPDCSKAYQTMPAAEALAMKEDLILWPPLVVIHNSSVWNEKGTDLEAVKKERMEATLREMGFPAGFKVCRGDLSNCFVVKFMPTFSGLKEAERLHDYFFENKQGRKDLELIASKKKKVRGTSDGKMEDFSLHLYGYMGTAEDLVKVDPETKKRCVVKSMKEIKAIADASLT